MVPIRFEWNPRKAKSNERKHGVSFEEAQSVFHDEQALLLEDPGHGVDEERFILLGMSTSLRRLVVVHSSPRDDRIRIIYAGNANRMEIREYEMRLGLP